jgi:hypothetical protein
MPSRGGQEDTWSGVEASSYRISLPGIIILNPPPLSRTHRSLLSEAALCLNLPVRPASGLSWTELPAALR